MMNRDPHSHKGQNGKVMIIGGSALFHGAPILCALGAEYSGVDLVFPFLPPCHAQVARTYSLNFILHTFEKINLGPKDVKPILEWSEKVDTVVIGPGLGSEKETQKAIITLLHELQKPTVVDASALIYTNSLPKQTILTPHRGEFKKLTKDDPTEKNVQKWAKNLGVTILCKGPVDIIADSNQVMVNTIGNAAMTVGGTGDVLSGLIGGLVAQGYPPIEACEIAVKALGKGAEYLTKHQNSLRAMDLAEEIPIMLRQITEE